MAYEAKSDEVARLRRQLADYDADTTALRGLEATCTEKSAVNKRFATGWKILANELDAHDPREASLKEIAKRIIPTSGCVPRDD